MRKLYAFFILLLSNYFVQAQNPDQQKVEALMHQQEACWNRSDIDGFMTTYWKSDSLQFIGSKGITYGWQATLNNYKKSYPNKASMGELKFTILSNQQFSDNVIYIIGKWELRREKPVGGYFTLLWKKINNQWVIVTDHTS
ncbi:MAG: nuclear transport factor 2 family protein [Bacteroidia bacterium]|nr:nuclear transport factor 2 family protein [Bacteroidia bacterium]